MYLCCFFFFWVSLLLGGGGGPQASESSAYSFDKLLTYIDKNETGVDGIVIIHNDKIVLEQYYGGYHRDKIHMLQSATKSITSALIGIAIDKGIIQSIEQPIFELLPEYSHLFSDKKKKITLKHLLEMSSGLDWRDWRTKEKAASSFDEINVASDSIAYILSQSLVTKPGDVFFYNTGSSHLLSAIIAHRAQMSALEFAIANLFKPMGIAKYFWGQLPPGIHKGGWDLYLRPLDMGKFGKLYLSKGKWDDVQLISQNWVELSTSFKKHSDQFDDGYAFHWWRPNGYDTEIYAALGYEGQCIYVLNDLNLVVVLTGRDGKLGYKQPGHMMKHYIVPQFMDLH